jgi:hypothetical protein
VVQPRQIFGRAAPRGCPPGLAYLNRLLDNNIGPASNPGQHLLRDRRAVDLVCERCWTTVNLTESEKPRRHTVAGRMRHARLTCDLDYLRPDGPVRRPAGRVVSHRRQTRGAAHKNCVIWLTIGFERCGAYVGDKDMFDLRGPLTEQP